MESSNGDLDLEQCIVKDLVATSSNGDVDIEDSSLTSSKLTSSNGDISVSLADSIANYTVSDDPGSIQVGHGSQKISAQTDNGDIDIEND